MAEQVADLWRVHPGRREWTKRAEELVKTAQRLAAGRSFDQASEELKQVEAEYQKPQRWWDNVREALASIRKNNELLNKKLSQLPDSSQTLTGWTEKLTASVEAKLLRDDGADGLAEARIIDEWMSKIDPLIQLRRKLTQTKMASRTFAGIPELKQTFEEVDQLVQEADNSLVQARLSDARHLYERAAERSSKATTLAAAHLSRLLDEGNKWLKTKSFDKAVAQFEQLIALRPQGPGAPELPEKGVALQLGSVLAQAYAGRAEAYIGQHDNDRAITDCAEALGLDPNLAQAYATRATAHCQMGVFDKAIADSEKALRINPKLTSAYTASAMAYSGKYNFDRAIANCNEAIRIQPEDVLALQVRGAAYNELCEFDKAVADCTEAIRFKPDDARSYVIRSHALYGKENGLGALADAEEAIRRGPRSPEASLSRGKALCVLKDYDLAIGAFDEAVRLDAKLAIAYKWRVSAYRAKGDKDRAASEVRDLIKQIDPRTAEDYFARGWCFVDQREYQRAKADLDNAIRMNPKYADAYYERLLLLPGVDGTRLGAKGLRRCHP